MGSGGGGSTAIDPGNDKSWTDKPDNAEETDAGKAAPVPKDKPDAWGSLLNADEDPAQTKLIG